MIIIGITGTIGAGKGTIVDYLVQKRGFHHFSVRAYLIQEIERRGMPVNRDSMVAVANDLRAKYGSAYIVQQLYEQSKAGGENAIIESIRAVGEIQALKGKEHFHLFAIDADPKVRYERVAMRGTETDKISYDEFINDEQREMQNMDPAKQNIAECMKLADHTFTNDGSVEELYAQIDAVLERMKI